MESPPTATASRAPQMRSLDTRTKILDAAVLALVQDGYSGATTLRIQQLAGVSRGRLLHHYPSRDDLLVAAVAHLTQVQIDALARDVSWPDDQRDRVSAAVTTMWDEFRQPYFWASIELWLAARVSKRLQDVLVPHERRLGAHIRAKTDSFFGPSFTDRTGYPDLREILLSSMRGVALTYAFVERPAESDPHLAQWKRAALALLPDDDGEQNSQP